jgi:ABC-type transporter Mla MlaB component
MHITHRSSNNVSVIYLTGSLNREGIHQLEYLLDHSSNRLRHRIQLNLSGIRELDPDCLGYLENWIANIRRKGREIALTEIETLKTRGMPTLSM